MATVYISSTYKDLIAEREAAALAVRRLNHRPIAMENYVATDQRPLDKCLEDVRNCNLYVGIFKWRYGFIPNGRTQSITHLEYLEAREHKIPCLIFLSNQPEPDEWPDGEDGTDIKQLRETLENRHMVSHFASPMELSAVVSPAVSNTLPTPSKKQGKKPLLSKLCDRVLQVKHFWEFFQLNWRKHPKRPQFYFIHGDENENHGSFLERLMKTCLKEFAEKEWGKEKATVILEETPWPTEGNATEHRELLLFNLKQKFDRWGKGGDDPTTLSRLPYLEKRPLVLIKHDIYSTKWDKHTMALINWYVSDFWGKLETDEECPLFLIFINVIYRKPTGKGLMNLFSRWKAYDKNDIMGELTTSCTQRDETCPCLLLDELKQVEIEHVLQWCDANEFYEDPLERREKVDAIFVDSGQLPVQYRPMAKVEKELRKIVEEHQEEVI